MLTHPPSRSLPLVPSSEMVSSVPQQTGLKELWLHTVVLSIAVLFPSPNVLSAVLPSPERDSGPQEGTGGLHCSQGSPGTA